MRTINHIDQILIGGDAAVSTGATLNDGEIGIFNGATGARMATAGSASGVEKIYFGQGRTIGGSYNPLFSDIIDLDQIVDMKQKDAVADQEQISTVGFNGTSGAIDLLANTTYYLRAYIEELITAHSDGRDYVQGNYVTGTTALGSRIAEGLAESLQNSLRKRPEKLMKVEVLTDVAAAAFGSGDGTDVTAATVAKGSKAVVATTGNFGTEVVAGDFLRIGEGALAVTDPVYRIASVESTTLITLDRPYEGDSSTTADIDFIKDGTGSGESDESGKAWGLKVTGEPLKFSVETIGKIMYDKSRFTLQMSAGSTPVVVSQGALAGSGQWEQIAEYEWFAQGDSREEYRMGEPNLFNTRRYTVEGEDYQLLDIHWHQREVGGFTPAISKKVLTVAVPNVADAAGYVTDGTNGLNVVFAALTPAIPTFTEP